MVILEIPLRHLNLTAVLLNGQSFRWLQHNGDFYGTAYSRVWKIRRIDEQQVEVAVIGSISGKDECGDEKKIISKYFNLHVDMDDLFITWSEADPFIKGLFVVSDDLKGIRILNQEPLETLFSFICSANNNIKRISKMVNRLCTLYGTQLNLTDKASSTDVKILELHPYLLYAFPTIDQLTENLDEMEEQLKKESFGYRAGYIAGSVRHLGTANVDLEEMRYPNEAKELLMQFPGVGPKVADCVALMSLGHNHVVPIDTHVFKSTVKNYRRDLGSKGLTKSVHESLGKFYQELFGEHAGWAQAVIFNAQLQNVRAEDHQAKRKKEKK